MTDTELVELSDSLLLFEDTCNAYALLDGGAALVVDPGSGEVLEALDEAGVEVEWALHTHHHRDQCWGTHRLVEAGADVAVPEYERYLFEDVETFWESKRVYDNYNDRSTFYTLAESVPVAATLEDYSVFEWRGYEFEVVPAKGHTFGSSALFVEVDGREVGFTGDLIHAGGRLQTLHDMEYTYGDVKGVPLTLESLSAVESRSADALLPSHGPPIDDPDGDIDALRDRLMDLVDLGMVESGARAYLPEMEMEQLSSHLLWGGPWTCSNFYVIVSESGKALFIDYGLSMYHHQHIGQDREDLETTRFVEHHLDELSEYGVTEFDVVVPTHIHDDHTCGIPHLQDHYDTECWALDDVAKVIEDPAAWSSTPCTFDKPVDVDRQFADGESFTWEEYEFDVYHAPGQTEFHSVVAVDVDGETVAFSGDNYFERERTTPADVYLNRREERPMQTTVLRNSFRLAMHQACKEVMRTVAPDRVCPGHGDVLDVDDDDIADYCNYIDRKDEAFRDLVPDPAEQGVDLFWARLLPYQAAATPGERVEYTLSLRNNFDGDREFRARLTAPGGDTVDEGAVTLAPDERGTVEFSLVVPESAGGRELVTAEVLVDGDSHGPVAEALVSVD